MNMCIPAGCGVKRNLRCFILAALLCPSFLLAAEQSAVAAEWVEAGHFVVAPRSSRILLLRQTGPDLVVRTATRDTGTGEQKIFEQDSLDNRFGTEAVLLENNASVPAEYHVSVKPRYPALTPTFVLTELERPDSDTIAIARLLSRAARLTFNADSDEALALWAQSIAINDSSPLQGLALVQQLQACFHISDFTGVLQSMSAMRPVIPFDTATSIYLGWMEATSQWQLRNVDVALQKFAALDILIQQNPEIASLGQYLDRQHIRAQWGATIVTAGVRDGSQAQMFEGARMIDEALSNAAQYDDYRLLGELHNYVSGYSAMMFNRLDVGGTKALDLAELYYERAQDVKSLAGIKNNKAFVLMGRGRVGEAQQLYREAVQMLAGTNDEYTYSFFLARLASTYLSTGDYQRAEFLYQESIRVMYANGFDKAATINEIELGITYLLQNRTEDAIALYENLLEKTSGDAWVEERLRIHTELARAHLYAGNIGRAREYAAIAAELTDRVNRLEYRLEYAVLNAGILIAEKQYGSAISLITATLANLQDDFQESRQQLELYHLLSQSYFDSQRFDEALATGRQAIAIASNTRSQIDINRQGPLWSARSAALVSQHTDHLLLLYKASGERRYLDEAFLTLQQSRALSLRQSRAANTGQPASQPAPDTEQLALLWEDMNEANQALLAASIRDQPLDALEDALLVRQEAWRMVASSVIPAELDLQEPPLSLEEIQNRLAAHTTAISFHVSDEVAFRFTITRDSIDGVFEEDLPALNDLISTFADDLAPGSTTDAASFVALSAFLLPDAVLSGQSETLIIEADGTLGRLPFSALPLTDAEGLVPAVMRYATVRANSLSSYFSGSDAAEMNPENAAIAIFADPVFQMPNSTSAAAGNTGSWTALEQLPYTRVEANSIRERFSSRNPQLFVGQDATISNLLSPASRNAGILHIATHGFASASNVDLSGLAFSPDPDSPSGLLTVAEIGKHIFNNRLVVISGCDTGQGQLLEGEGIMSLSRAFMAQGAQAVIATLWPISDRATATFMAYFYEALLEQHDISAALQAAQLRLNDNPQYRHPYYWSGFTLTVAENTAVALGPSSG